MKISLSIREFRPPFHSVFRFRGLEFRAGNEPRHLESTCRLRCGVSRCVCLCVTVSGPVHAQKDAVGVFPRLHPPLHDCSRTQPALHRSSEALPEQRPFNWSTSILLKEVCVFEAPFKRTCSANTLAHTRRSTNAYLTVMCMYAYRSLCVHVRPYMHACMRLCARVCVCACALVHVCTCARGLSLSCPDERDGPKCRHRPCQQMV